MTAELIPPFPLKSVGVENQKELRNFFSHNLAKRRSSKERSP